MSARSAVQKAARLTISQACALLNATLPRQTFSPAATIALARHTQQQHYVAYRPLTDASDGSDGEDAYVSL